MKMDHIADSKILLESIHADIIRENELNLKLGMYVIDHSHISFIIVNKNSK